MYACASQIPTKHFLQRLELFLPCGPDGPEPVQQPSINSPLQCGPVLEAPDGGRLLETNELLIAIVLELRPGVEQA
ncbi:hypothetical protein M406DRAFT_320079 [Cryphonectria parasitica EP155]|uniref:Uncharacterized protein n=1 Tax=Cryphonectria parasitica (strain ATCC 38755 / EP155) TaxID=660469 RepID=A0A9P4YB86_CRYP1|nr:uncharacterized protein M406DRAFT_320079 [Cryphonectria parasitica EP155]KAF3769855.1 hypothetical protein M406DRAFT_320079 [Cryphonectria parasitica EP155]